MKNISTEVKKIVLLNGSPRKDSISTTYECLTAWGRKMKQDVESGNDNYDRVELCYLKIPNNLMGCQDCENCEQRCRHKDGFQAILDKIEWATDVVIGTPVYLDMATPQTVALLTRLNCMAESTGREFFRKKRIWLLATSYCSGTKSAIHMMMGACEMLGFTIPGRSTREYIKLWKDTKLRGGMSFSDSVWLTEE